MIRINLLGVERQKVKAAAFDISQHTGVLCAVMLVLASAGTGWWFWSLRQESAQVDADTAAANREAARLKSVLNEVQQFEARTKQLQERVQLIERLRAGQSVPVQLLDHISRSLPDMLWLTDLQQEGARRHDSGAQHDPHRTVGFRRQPGQQRAAGQADRDRQQPGRAGRDARKTARRRPT